MNTTNFEKFLSVCFVIGLLAIVLVAAVAPYPVLYAQEVGASSASPDMHGSCVWSYTPWHVPAFGYAPGCHHDPETDYANYILYRVDRPVTSTGKPPVIVDVVPPTQEPPVVVVTPVPPTVVPPVVVVDPPIVIDPPVIVPPVVDPPADDVCKNKNSGKDGTPAECNAGKGQEKNKDKKK